MKDLKYNERINLLKQNKRNAIRKQQWAFLREYLYKLFISGRISIS